MKVTFAIGNRPLVLAWLLFTVSSIAIIVQEPGFEIFAVIEVANLVVGTIIIVRRPGNIVGPILAVLGVSWVVVIAADVSAETLAESGRIGAAGWVALVATVATVPLLWMGNVAIWLLFPDGRPQAGWGRRFLHLSAVYALIATVATVFAQPRVLGPGAPSQPHPFLDPATAERFGDVALPVVALIFLQGFAAAGMLFARVRHSDGIERRQIGWVALAVIVDIALTLVNGFFHPLGSADERAFLVFDAVIVVVLSGALGVAITRYRLYEIDRIINRSVTYGGLALFVAAAYVAIVVGIGQLFAGQTELWVSMVATVLVAMAFHPVRRRMERWANRLVYGPRSTPHEVLAQFSQRSSDLPDDELMDRIPRLIVEGTSAEQASLWIAAGSGFSTVSSWPPDPTERVLERRNEFVDPDADHSLPIFHGDDVLGGVSLASEPGETLTPSETELLTDLASGLGLALRNVRLTDQLRRQVDELEASRERVLAAADSARLELERTLDSGPQQQLVAVKVKLGPIRKRAEQLGATKTAALISQLEDNAGETIQAVRAFARGVQPPLLDAEGLVVAIDRQARQSTIPVSVSGDGVGRYSRNIESAVYFVVLEALQNTVKYAHATNAEVTLSAVNGSLEFSVSDDGLGFDPAASGNGSGLAGMAERLEHVAGDVHVESAKGSGTTVRGSIPIPTPAAMA